MLRERVNKGGNMSYTKDILERFVNEPVKDIKKKTIEHNDCSEMLERVNNLFTVRDKFIERNSECGTLWNEICIDALAIINSAFSGFYRTATIGLRSILEMGCSSIFYYDHLIEYYMFQKENMKADKYVSVLVNEYNFFKTKYIRAFKNNIDELQTEEDSVSRSLTRLYSELSDVVHGRYEKLSNVDEFNIEYNVEQYKQFEKLFIKTVDTLLLLATLRFDIELESQDKIFRNTGVIKYE